MVSLQLNLPPKIVLEYFIIVCNKENQVKSKLPKKEKLESAINGKHNLIKLAFDSKLMENFIKKLPQYFE